MDAFKHAEIQRVELGGNEPWKAFYDAHAVTVSEGRTFEDSTIKERYEGDAGEEWKERLSCKVEGREYVPGQEKKNNASRSSTPMSLGGAVPTAGTRTGSPSASSIRSQDSLRGPSTKKEQNEAYFSKLGSENSTRSDVLPPSQGGKFTGFGGGMPAPAAGDRRSSPFGGFGGLGGLGGNQQFDEFQKDPMGSLTKGFGWFASTVGKSAKQVNDSYLQPTAKQVCIHTDIEVKDMLIIHFCSSPSQTSLLKPGCRLPTGVRTCRPASAAPQTNSTASLKVKTAVLRAPALNQSVEISGMTSRLLAKNAMEMATVTRAAGHDLM